MIKDLFLNLNLAKIVAVKIRFPLFRLHAETLN
jgi:hypothetical protein